MHNLSISKKILFTFIFIGIAISIFFFNSINSLLVANKKLEDFANYSYNANEAIMDMEIQINLASKLISEMIIDADENNTIKHTYTNEIENSLEKLQESIVNLKKSYRNPTSDVSDMESKVNKWIDSINNVLNILKNNNLIQAKQLLLSESKNAYDNMIHYMREIDIEIEESVYNDITSNQQYMSLVIICSTIFFLIMFVICYFLARSTRLSIFRPVKEIQQAAVQLSQGDLNTTISYQSKDELGHLADSLRNSISILHSYVQDISKILTSMASNDMTSEITLEYIGDFIPIQNALNNISNSLNNTINQIRIAAEQVSNGADIVAQSAQNLAFGATQQSNSIEQLSSSIKEISTYMQHNSDNARIASQLSTKAMHSVEQTNHQMQNMIVAMKEINTSSDEIEKIIKTIDEIAFQTNILALNAAIEASRAGEMGKGFAVVASEVRDLANKSTEAAKNTTMLIEKTISSVQNGTVIANNTANTLSEIVNITKNSAQVMSQIDEESTQQVQIIKRIYNNVKEISDVVQSNTADSQEAAATSQEMSTQATFLKDLVSDFKLKY